MLTAEIREGATYETSVAVWTVESISPNGMVFVRRDDGRSARFALDSFATWCVKPLATEKPGAASPVGHI